MLSIKLNFPTRETNITSHDSITNSILKISALRLWEFRPMKIIALRKEGLETDRLTLMLSNEGQLGAVNRFVGLLVVSLLVY
jgi:hypothetical protein